jgi:transcriptional regulator with XRE-family HTH domain
MSNVNIGLSITKALQIRGRSQKWLALTIGTTPNLVSRWSLKKTASLETIQKIAGAFDMKVSDFISLGEQG